MKKIVFDCDNTMGITHCDVDDGLALLYAMGCKDELEVLAICTSYGAHTIQAVDINTKSFIRRFDFTIPVYRGAARNESPISEASRALVKLVHAHPHEVTIIATGSLTNLLGAYREEPHFFELAEHIIISGGITASCMFSGGIQDETNLSSDLDAAMVLLKSTQNGAKVSFMPRNESQGICLTKRDICEVFSRGDAQDAWVQRVCAEWMDCTLRLGRVDELCCQDVLCLAYVAYPEYFIEDDTHVALNKKLLSVGFLDVLDSEKVTPEIEGYTAPVAFIRVQDAADIAQHVKSIWKKRA